jgi:Fe-S cluster assembly ATP-binding protein
MSTLEIRNLHASVGEREILKGIDLVVSSGEVHAVMGPNGAGKSTLSGVVMGKPGYVVTAGSVTLDGVDMLALPTWERAVAGLHLVMQYPTEVPGVMLDDVLTEALSSRGRSTDGLDALMRAEAGRIGFDERFLDRALNVDLSGGEKKRNETLQLAVLSPRIAILDELDSGLDIDALRDCARRVELMSNEGTGDAEPLGVLAITHYNRLLHELKPDHVHILAQGRIVASGGAELAVQLETDGYAAFAVESTDTSDTSADSSGNSASDRPSSLDDLFAS